MNRLSPEPSLPRFFPDKIWPQQREFVADLSIGQTHLRSIHTLLNQELTYWENGF